MKDRNAIALALAPVLLLCLGNRARCDSPQKSIRLGVADVIDNESCILKRLAISVPPGAKVEFFSDAGSYMASSPAGEDRTVVHLNILADLFRGIEGERGAVKLMYNLSGGTTTKTTNVSGDQKLVEIAKFRATPGNYAVGSRIPVLWHDGREYFLRVTALR